MPHRSVLLRIGAAAVLALALATGIASANAASGTSPHSSGEVHLRGAVTCPSGDNVEGVYVHSSGGGSTFATWSAYAGYATTAHYYTAFTTNLPTSIYLSVGCGGSTQGWKYAPNSPSKTVSSGAVWLYDDVTCSTTSCSFPSSPKNTGSTTTNPFSDPKDCAAEGAPPTCECTYRAASFWKTMTGHYPDWNGNAADWDTNAAAKGWSVWTLPRPGVLFVEQGTKSNPYGHVGFVADVRNSGGVLQMKIYDRNYDFKGSDRNGVWINWSSSDKMIMPPPWYGSDY